MLLSNFTSTVSAQLFPRSELRRFSSPDNAMSMAEKAAARSFGKTIGKEAQRLKAVNDTRPWLYVGMVFHFLQCKCLLGATIKPILSTDRAVRGANWRHYRHAALDQRCRW